MKLYACIAVAVAVAISYYIETISSIQYDRSILTEVIDDEYDYIIVGGGSAGSVVASRLSEDGDKTVLLLEAGGFYDENPDLHIPLKALNLQQSKFDWGYYTESQKYSQLGMLERKSYWPRGKVLGGTGMLNCLQYTRGSRHDYDEWARNGCTGWSYEDVLPYFLKSEDMQIDELKSSPYHASGGPLAVTSGTLNKPLGDVFKRAGQELGYNLMDYNGADMEGFSEVQSNVRDGVRSSSSLEYLGRSGRRDNLHISVNSMVTKVNIHNHVATGVFYVNNNKKGFVKARNEIIVSAGAVKTPQLLMLSGIGPKDHLKELAIPVNADLPVGENLQDHIMLIMQSTMNTSLSILPDVHTNLLNKIKYKLFHSIPLSLTGLNINAFLYLDEKRRGKTYTDIQFVSFDILLYQSVIGIYNLKEDIANEFLVQDEQQPGFFTLVVLSHPKSRGTIKLKSSDPFDYPAIDPNYLSNRQDIEDLIGGVRIWEKYIETNALREVGVDVKQMKFSFCSEHKFRSDAYWECVIRHLAVTVHHETSTCKMGAETDDTAVLDPKLRVKGIKGLRVVDASIFPNITTGNTNIPSIMAAEKLADTIRGGTS